MINTVDDRPKLGKASKEKKKEEEIPKIPDVITPVLPTCKPVGNADSSLTTGKMSFFGNLAGELAAKKAGIVLVCPDPDE